MTSTDASTDPQFVAAAALRVGSDRGTRAHRVSPRADQLVRRAERLP
jgi:hypothetical protein